MARTREGFPSLAVQQTCRCCPGRPLLPRLADTCRHIRGGKTQPGEPLPDYRKRDFELRVDYRVGAEITEAREICPPVQSRYHWKLGR